MGPMGQKNKNKNKKSPRNYLMLLAE